MRAEYLLLLAGCVAITLPLEAVLGARVYRRPRILALSLLPVVVVFGAWDLLGIARGHWWYEPSRISGIMLPGRMPIEELLFFVVVPLCALLTFEGVHRVLALAARWRGRAARPAAETAQHPEDTCDGAGADRA